MRMEFVFIIVIIPGPSNPKKKIYVYLCPLIDELKMLREDGAVMYDVLEKAKFCDEGNLKVAK